LERQITEQLIQFGLKILLAIVTVKCYNSRWTFLKGVNYCEGKVISKTNLREMQDHQKEGCYQSYLREPQTQTKTRLIYNSSGN